MKTKEFYKYDANNEYSGTTIAYESPLEPGKYLNSPMTTEKKPTGNKNVFDGEKWIYKKKYIGVYYNKTTKQSVEINSFELSDGFTKVEPKEFDEWIDGEWTENTANKNKKVRQDKLQSKYNKELSNFIWKEVKKNKDGDLDTDDLIEVDKKIK